MMYIPVQCQRLPDGADCIANWLGLSYSMLLETDLARIDVSHLHDKRRLSDAGLKTAVSIIRVGRQLEFWLFLLSDTKPSYFQRRRHCDCQEWLTLDMKRVSSIWEGKSAEIGDWMSNCIFWAGKTVAIADWRDGGSTCEGRFAEMPCTWGKWWVPSRLHAAIQFILVSGRLPSGFVAFNVCGGCTVSGFAGSPPRLGFERIVPKRNSKRSQWLSGAKVWPWWLSPRESNSVEMSMNMWFELLMELCPERRSSPGNGPRSELIRT